MKSIELRKKFITFFKSKNHDFVKSSPMVLSDDPTLMFVNAGMNQFKDIFLGNSKINHSRVVNSQKCLRVSGKHNDLEEVGHDTYHHTMFEMLGNWSFGDYFKEEAISMAWEFLTDILEIDAERLYVTYFAGDDVEDLAPDLETKNLWSNIINSHSVIKGSKRDNFWEMGKIGPCGPSTEIHVDLRSEEDRKLVNARELINHDHPQVIEIWNLVFISFNRKEDNSLEVLPRQHVDTGMGFERLAMVVQGQMSTYDTDVFSDLIKRISIMSNIDYGYSKNTDIAIRVIVDHIRAIVFSISDGQLPSNTGAGYVIRRILRRAVRYGYTYLRLKDPFLNKLVESLSNQFKIVFPEIHKQRVIIKNIIEQEEKVFLKTLGKGLDLINSSIALLKKDSTEMNGSAVFELYDTYGFPPDLTALILQEKNLSFSQTQFDVLMQEQKHRSRAASEIVLGDWIEVNNIEIEGFVGYNQTEVSDAKIVKYRKVKIKGENQFHLVFNKTPFYPEGGGQKGDVGSLLISTIGKLSILDTKKDNNLIIHISNELLPNIEKINMEGVILKVDSLNRRLTTCNHSATHLLHNQLRLLLGSHVEQKGSYVGLDYLRFDFSHFEKIDNKLLLELEDNINSIILLDLQLQEFRDIPIKKAKSMGCLALFGEKYGKTVRMIKFGDSVELCGGTHVSSTAEIGCFKIISESSVASGIRRIEAVTNHGAFKFLNNKINILNQLENVLKNPHNIINSVDKLINDNRELNILAQDAKKDNTNILIKELNSQILECNDIKYLFSELDIDASAMKNICFSFLQKHQNIVLALATKKDDKLILNIALSKKLVQDKELNASKLINQVARHINGRGGGQPFFAVASGDNLEGLDNIFSDLKEMIQGL